MSAKKDCMDSLTRESDIHDDLIKNKIINDASYNSKITTINFYNSNIKYKWISKWSNLTESGIENISISKYKYLQNLTPGERNDELYRTNSTHDWTIDEKDVDISLILNFYVEVKSMNSSEIKGSGKIQIDSWSDLSLIQNLIVANEKDKNIDLKMIDDSNFKINYSGQSYDCEIVDEFRYNQTCDLVSNIIDYSKFENKWVKSTICNLKHDNDNIYLIVNFEDTFISFAFNPNELDNGLWHLADEFGYSDPLMLENEEVYITFSEYTNKNGIIQNGLWTVKKEKPNINRYSKLYDKLKSLF